MPGDANPDVLIAQARGGDEAALGTLLELYRNYLRLVARPLMGVALRVKLEPSDLIQETFLKAHREFAGFAGSGEREFVAWLRRILARTLADEVKYLRRKGRDLKRQESLDQLLEQSGLEVQNALASRSFVTQRRRLPARAGRASGRCGQPASPRLSRGLHLAYAGARPVCRDRPEDGPIGRGRANALGASAGKAEPFAGEPDMNLGSRIALHANADGVEPGASQDSELARVLDAYLAAIEAGHAIDPTALAAAHPAIAERLLACLSVLRVASQVEGQCGADSQPDAALGSAADNCLGDFRILRLIGRGGMGIVYEAEQVSLRRRVALKVLPFAAALDSQQLHRFQIESQAAAQLHHTNIVPIFSVGCERGVHYYAMQYIEGQTLAALIHDLRALAGLDESHYAPPGASSHHAPRDGLEAHALAPHTPESGSEAPPDASSHRTSGDAPESPPPPAHDPSSHEGNATLHPPAPPPNDSLAAEMLHGLFAAQPGAIFPRPNGEGVAEGRARGRRLEAPPTSAPPPTWLSRPPKPSTTPIASESSTATSSRPICWSTCTATSGSPTSAWPACKPTAA